MRGEKGETVRNISGNQRGRSESGAKVGGTANGDQTVTAAPDRNGQTLKKGAHRVTAIPHSTPTNPVRTVPKSSRTRNQYRVVSKREGNCEKVVTFASLKKANDRIGLLTTDEPWRFYGDEFDRQRDGGELNCCEGTVYDQCACGGLTVREAAMQKREGLPKIEWVRLDVRQITTTPWEPVV